MENSSRQESIQFVHFKVTFSRKRPKWLHVVRRTRCTIKGYLITDYSLACLLNIKIQTLSRCDSWAGHSRWAPLKQGQGTGVLTGVWRFLDFGFLVSLARTFSCANAKSDRWNPKGLLPENPFPIRLKWKWKWKDRRIPRVPKRTRRRRSKKRSQARPFPRGPDQTSCVPHLP